MFACVFSCACARDFMKQKRTLGTPRLLGIVWPFIAVVLFQALLGSVSLYVLSAVRGYVAGESLWSKGQKDAIYYLTLYADNRLSHGCSLQVATLVRGEPDAKKTRRLSGALRILANARCQRHPVISHGRRRRSARPGLRRFSPTLRACRYAAPAHETRSSGHPGWRRPSGGA